MKRWANSSIALVRTMRPQSRRRTTRSTVKLFVADYARTAAGVFRERSGECWISPMDDMRQADRPEGFPQDQPSGNGE